SDPAWGGGGEMGQEQGTRRRSGSRAGGDIVGGDPLAAPPRASYPNRDRRRRRSHAGTVSRHRPPPKGLYSRSTPIAPDDGFNLRSRAARIRGAQSNRQCARSTRGGA